MGSLKSLKYIPLVKRHPRGKHISFVLEPISIECGANCVFNEQDVSYPGKRKSVLNPLERGR